MDPPPPLRTNVWWAWATARVFRCREIASTSTESWELGRTELASYGKSPSSFSLFRTVAGTLPSYLPVRSPLSLQSSCAPSRCLRDVCLSRRSPPLPLKCGDTCMSTVTVAPYPPLHLCRDRKSWVQVPVRKRRLRDSSVLSALVHPAEEEKACLVSLSFLIELAHPEARGSPFAPSVPVHACIAPLRSFSRLVCGLRKKEEERKASQDKESAPLLLSCCSVPVFSRIVDPYRQWKEKRIGICIAM